MRVVLKIHIGRDMSPLRVFNNIVSQWKTFTIANRDITHVCFCFLLKQTKPNNVWNLKWIKIIILLRQRYLKLLFSDTKWNFTIRWICLYRIFVEIFCYWWNIKSLLKILLFWQQNVIVLNMGYVSVSNGKRFSLD
jgi:hypothetical protein